MISKGEASPKRGPEGKRTERMATTFHSQLDGATHPLYTRGHHHHPPPPRCLNTTHPAHHLPLQPPSTPSTPFHAPPSPYQPRARLQHSHPCIHLFPITATLISPPPPSTRHDQTRPASHTVPPKRCRRRYPAIQPHRPIFSPKPCVHVSQAPPKEWPPLPLPGWWW